MRGTRYMDQPVEFSYTRVANPAALNKLFVPRGEDVGGRAIDSPPKGTPLTPWLTYASLQVAHLFHLVSIENASQ